MALMVVCALLLLAGLAMLSRWGGCTVVPPAPSDARPDGAEFALRTLWWLNLAVIAGLGAGALAAGPGGRLVMRLLAVTAGDKAQGRITEADEVVGEISLSGTFGLFVFGGLIFGLFSALLYVLIRRWLPSGWAGGILYGVLLLVLVSTRADPLRRDNPDFDIVGPGWLSVLTYGVGMVVIGMLVAAIAGRVSRTLPLPSRRLPVLAAYTPLVVTVLFVPIAITAVLLGLLAFVLSRIPSAIALWRDPRLLIAGRVVLALVALAALPGFAASISDILGRP